MWYFHQLSNKPDQKGRKKMKKTMLIAALAAMIGFNMAADASAAIKYINGYYKSNGSYTRGHYRDTSGDGNPYNNANYLGYN